MYSEDQNASHNNSAIVGTTSGIYFLTKSFISSGFSHFNTWDDFLKKAYVYSEIGLFNSKIIVEIKKIDIVLITTKFETNNFISYISNKKTQSDEGLNITHYTSSSDIINSLSALKKLFDEGIISEKEFELKKAKLLKRL